MDEEFLKKFVGKEISIYTVGDSEMWPELTVVDVHDGILQGKIRGELDTFIECDMIVGITGGRSK